MPYITTERVAQIRKELKATFPTIKFSVTREHHSSVNVVIMEAPFNMLPEGEKSYEIINHFYIKEQHKDTPQKCEILLRVYEIMNAGNGTLVNDGDYGNVPRFYTHISIGKWDRPFKVTETKKSNSGKIVVLENKPGMPAPISAAPKAATSN